jgi:hypothetical protein
MHYYKDIEELRVALKDLMGARNIPLLLPQNGSWLYAMFDEKLFLPIFVLD